MEGYLLGISLFITAKVAEFLSLISVSFSEKVTERFSEKQPPFELALERLQMITILTLIFIPATNFLLCDLFIGVMLKNTAFIVLGLLIELFIPMISSYLGETFSKKVEKRHIKKMLYREVEIGSWYSLISVRKVVPVVVLNEETLSGFIKLIYKSKNLIYINLLCIIYISIIYINLMRHKSQPFRYMTIYCKILL